jgi:hypothetical protein
LYPKLDLVKVYPYVKTEKQTYSIYCTVVRERKEHNG